MVDDDGRLVLEPEYLAQQRDLKIEEITELHPEIISRQATINIGAIGHVAHGKSSLTKALTNVDTVKFSDEKVNNITIMLGYANAKIYECENPSCSQEYYTAPSDKPDNHPCDRCKAPGRLVRHISIIDCPGHDQYMTTMLSGAAIMDATLLLIAADVPCPQSQTQEHLQAVQINAQCREGLIVAQNKIDLVTRQQAEAHHGQITRFLATALQGGREPPIIPISAARKLNIQYVVAQLARLPAPRRALSKPPLFISVRSFDTNKSGAEVASLQGGVIGGTLLQGVLRLGDVVEIRPGVVDRRADGCPRCYPLVTKVVSMQTEHNALRVAIPGGLVALGTLLDPAITKHDRMIGQVVGVPGHMPPIMSRIRFAFNQLVNRDNEIADYVQTNLTQIVAAGRELSLTVTGCTVAAQVIRCDHSTRRVVVDLSEPICVPDGATIAVSSKNLGQISKNCRLIGYGVDIEDAWDDDTDKGTKGATNQ